MGSRKAKGRAYRDFDHEEIEKAHISKGSNLKIRENLFLPHREDIHTTVVTSAGKEFDHKEIENAHASKARNVGIDIGILEESFEPGTKPCIYRVPRDLHKISKEAYTPHLVSIGPLHHRKGKHLIGMEEQKLTYVKKFGERTSKDTLKEFKCFIEHNQRRIRSCYAEKSNLPYEKFVTMILHDAVFIIELFLRNDENKSEFDSLLHTPIQKYALMLDLQLLENQLPYFVLQKLFLSLGGEFAKLNGEDQHYRDDPFLILTLRFFDHSELNHLTYLKRDILHFTDLRRCFIVKKFNPQNNSPNNKHIRDLPCATKLDGSGVKFEKSDGEESSLKICCDKEHGLEVKIPHFVVDDETECLFRNVMAFEQLHYPWKTHVCNYILLMDFLIDTEKDVDLLIEKKIIHNCLGNNMAIANMFNKLGLKVTPSFSCYYKEAEMLKAHYEIRWNHAKATFKRVYFGDPWIGTGTVVAALLLLLTLVQTVCSILQVL